MKKIRKILTLAIAAVMTASLSACAVPYTYADAVGKYVGENRDAFSDQLDQIHEAVAETIESGTTDKETQEFILRLLGMDSEADLESTSKAEEPSAIPNIPETAPSGRPEKEDSDESESLDEPESSGSGSEAGDTKDASGDTQESSKNTKETSEDTKESSEGTGIVPAAPAPEEKSESSNDGESSGGTLGSCVPEYVHYEKKDFEKLCEDFTAAGKKGDADEIQRLYDETKEMLTNIGTMEAVSFILYSTNVNDSTYDEEYQYSEKLFTECSDLFMTACHDVWDSEGKKAFEDYVDPDFVEEVIDYEPLSDRTKELLEQEDALISKYNAEQSTVNEVSYTYKGKTYTLQDLYDDSPALTFLSLFDYTGFLEVYENLLKGINDRLGPIYVELLQIRKELAKEYEVDSYADYCYSAQFGRSYTTEDAEKFCENIKKNMAPRYYSKAYDQLYGITSSLTTKFSTEEMLQILEKFSSGMDEFTQKAFREMVDNELYNIGEGDGRYQGSYTTSLYSVHKPYIFVNSGDNLEGISTLTHEFGHFVNDLYEEEKYPDYILTTGNYDVLEIHSSAFQLICTNLYPDIVNAEEAEAGQKYVVSSELDSICEGCIFDEFQRKAYENPDMTLDELNEMYKEICESYGQSVPNGLQYSWVMINHSYESPMYYISYAISALSSLEIWMISQDDMDKAFDCWLQILQENDEQDYEKIMKDTGLTSFMDSKGVLEICDKALELFNDN